MTQYRHIKNFDKSWKWVFKNGLFVVAIFTMLSCQQPTKNQVKETPQPISQQQVALPVSLIDSSTTILDYDIPLKNVNPDSIPNDYFVPLFYEGQLCHWVRQIFQDSRGDLWFGTNHYGVIKYSDHTISYISKNEGLSGNRLNSITEDQKGNTWFGTAGGLTSYNGNNFKTYTIKDGLINNEIWCLFHDSNDLLWIGTIDGLCTFDGNTFNTVSAPLPHISNANPILADRRITAILEDQHGAIWIGTDGYGIIKLKGSSISYLNTQHGLADNNISGLLEDNKGHIWVSSMYGGISKYNGQQFENFTADGKIKGKEVSGLFQDDNNTIWFSAEHEGVFSYNGEEFTNYYKNEGLFSGGIISIFKDQQDRFWFGGWKGLFRFEQRKFEVITKSGPWE